MAGMSMPGCPYPQYCSGGAASEECVMSMVFHSSSTVCVLLSGWYVSSAAQWLLLALFVAALAAAREFLLVYRQHRARQRRLQHSEAREANAPLSAKSAFSTPAAAPSSSSSSGPLSLSWPSSPARRPRWAGTDDDSASRRSSLLPPSVDASSLSTLPASLSWSDVSVAGVDSLIYLLSVTLAYVLMLLVMTYNLPLCALVVLLSAAAHLTVNLAFTACWRREAQLRAARRLSDADGEHSLRAGQRQQRDGYVEVGAPPVLIEEVRAASDPCCGQVDDIE